MIVGTLRVRLLIRSARSLKDKRQVIKSIKDRLRNEFNISIAEIEAQDSPQLAVLGMAMVSNEAHAVKQTLGKIVEALKSDQVAEFLEHELEV
jgi:uncharacterized protein YlxP (DUF503 family)